MRRLEADDAVGRGRAANRSAGVGAEADRRVAPRRSTTPVPPDEPDGVRADRAGLRVCPPSELCAPPDANSDMFTLARMIAPASRSFFTTNASSGGTEPSSRIEPPVVGMSTVSKLSFRTMGMPCSGERGPLAFRSASSARAVSSAFGLSVMHRAQVGPLPIVGLDAREAHLHQPFRGQRAGFERGVEIGDGRGVEIDGFRAATGDQAARTAARMNARTWA